ncbi:DUF7282 domain-containing protein [Halobacterium jilantaiense]|uniref:DUF7282 domain-containing protein n=1 Tax=Halobacterium jilantaiense TaxID=355548 RepID=A0A1I0P2Z0_9EURY|nr:hypothetical protein [Halobacterium jilantaiense]SEW08702.1 hypothetical protein SAMN04487945_1362 [Halobacterium jilantaiense]
MERIAVAVVALLVVAAGVVAPVAATDPNDESASLGENYVTVTRGDSVDISVSHSTDANLTIGGSGDGFEVRIPLGGSGSNTITLDTYNTTSINPADFLSVDGAELKSAPIDQALEPGQYTLSVTVEGQELARGTLAVQPRTETTGKMGIAPDDLDFEEASVGEAFDAITERDTVARSDYAAVVVNESGLSWALPESGVDVRLNDDIDVTISELDPEPNTVAETYGRGQVDVVSRVGDTGEFAVLWDTTVPVTRNSNNTYELRLTLSASSNLVEEDETLVRERVRVVNPSVGLTGSPSFTLAPWDNGRLEVTGQTNLAPSTTLDVRALQEESPQKLWRNVVTVAEDGSFSTAFAFGTANVPGELPLWVLGHRSQSEETVSLTRADAALSFADQQADEQSVVVENVSLSHGGFVSITGNITGNGTSTVGVSRHLGAGDHGNVSVPLVDPLENETTLTATAVADANRNASLDDGDVAYEVDGTVVAANASVRPSPEPVDNTTTTTSASNNTTTAATTQRSLDTEESVPMTPNQASGGGSGGTVPLSPVLVVVALAASALLAGRE